jgi:hypothetical protein
MNASDGRSESKRSIGEPVDWAPRLAGILDEQRRLCGELERLSGQQGERIHSGDTNALMSVLGERQEIIDRLTHLNSELEPYRREWDWCMGRLPANQREGMEQTVRELGEMIDRIWASDDADRAELERRRSAVSSELSNLSRGRVAMSAYGVRPAGTGPMYQDRSC